MTIKELKEILNKFSENMEVLVKAGDEGYCYDISPSVTRANVELGEIFAEEDDEDSEFSEKNCVLLLDVTQ